MKNEGGEAGKGGSGRVTFSTPVTQVLGGVSTFDPAERESSKIREEGGDDGSLGFRPH